MLAFCRVLHNRNVMRKNESSRQLRRRSDEDRNHSPARRPAGHVSRRRNEAEFSALRYRLSYSYPEEELAKRPAQPANTLIEVGVPYCFHVPDQRDDSGLKDAKATSHLVFKKIWTESRGGFERARTISRRPTCCITTRRASRTPNFPTEPNLGPEPICTGTNVEALKDQAGLYRYSLVWMFFDTGYTRETLTSEAGGQAARSEVIARAVAALNRFIDIYRVVTGSAHIQRLSSVHVRDIFFQEHNIGFHGASFGHGIGTAIMNRSEAELNEIVSRAASGEEIPPWDLLFLDAKHRLRPMRLHWLWSTPSRHWSCVSKTFWRRR